MKERFFYKITLFFEMVHFLFLPEGFCAFGEAFVGGVGGGFVWTPAVFLGDVAAFVGLREGAQGV